MEETECFETLAYKSQRPEYSPEESIKQGEANSLNVQNNTTPGPVTVRYGTQNNSLPTRSVMIIEQ
jgi:hypothetical protein